jgi:hypothetical protein
LGGPVFYSEPPQDEQNLAPAGFVWLQRVHALRVLGWDIAVGGTFTVTFKGWPQAGIGMPSAAAMPAA